MPRGLQYLTSLHTLTMFVVAHELNTDGGAKPLKHKAKLDELINLSLLRKLMIENLGGVINDLLVFEGVELKKKEHLRYLSLSWNDVEYAENALEKLEPPSTLEMLQIKAYQGVNFPKWFYRLDNLVVIMFKYCKKCKHLPPLSQLRCLKTISIWDCMDLRDVEDGRNLGGRIFPSLKTLVLDTCPKLEGWWKNEDYDDDTGTTQQLQFDCLSVLVVRHCQKLVSMPLFPNLDESLTVTDLSFKPLQQTLKMVIPVSTTAATSSSLVRPLSKLKNLAIEKDVKDLNCISGEWMQQLTSLQTLDLYDCSTMTKRCGGKRGDDWHKISHIPNILVDNNIIQKEGRYQLDD